MQNTTFYAVFCIMFQMFYIKRACVFVSAAYCSLYPGQFRMPPEAKPWAIKPGTVISSRPVGQGSMFVGNICIISIYKINYMCFRTEHGQSIIKSVGQCEKSIDQPINCTCNNQLLTNVLNRFT